MNKNLILKKEKLIIGISGFLFYAGTKGRLQKIWGRIKTAANIQLGFGK